MIQDDENYANLRERKLKLRESAMRDYSGMVMEMAEKTVTAKVTGRPAQDLDGRRDKRQKRDRRVILDDIKEQALAGVAPRYRSERTIGTQDFLRIDYFVKGLVAARSIGRLDALGGAYFGSGFLCAPGVIITNHHVLPSASIASKTHIGFETYDGLTVIPQCGLAPERFWWSSEDLDISIVALDPTRGQEISERLGWHPLLAEQGKVALGDPTAIIQYPEGRLKSVVLHDSTVVFIKDHRQKKIDRALWYTCDTEPGSSGSPVFNKHWEVVAVHHASVPARDDAGDLIDEDGRKVSQDQYERDPTCVMHVANKGIRVSRIVKALKSDPFESAPDHLPMKEAILRAWEQDNGQRAVLRRMRERISKEWTATIAAVVGTDDEPQFLESLERRATHRFSDRDLLEMLLDRVGPEGRVELNLIRGPAKSE